MAWCVWIKFASKDFAFLGYFPYLCSPTKGNLPYLSAYEERTKMDASSGANTYRYIFIAIIAALYPTHSELGYKEGCCTSYRNHWNASEAQARES